MTREIEGDFEWDRKLEEFDDSLDDNLKVWSFPYGMPSYKMSDIYVDTKGTRVYTDNQTKPTVTPEQAADNLLMAVGGDMLLAIRYILASGEYNHNIE